MRFDIITIFPHIFDSYFNESILKRAQEKKLVKITTHDLRKFSTAKSKVHRSVDDKPYGGGPGMILMIEPLVRALRAAKGKWRIASSKRRIILLTPAGKRFTQRDAERLAKYDQLILLCGRYEGFDARIEKYVDEQISIGDYVLAGGELAAMVVAEAVARNIKGVVGHVDALKDETFSHNLEYVEYPQYSRPEIFRSRMPARRSRGAGGANGKWQIQKVPKVLLSGDHGAVKKWRNKHANKRSVLKK